MGRFLRMGILALAALILVGCATTQQQVEEYQPPPDIDVPEGMVYVPPGKVKVTVYERRHPPGGPGDEELEWVNDGFFIDKYEYPNVEGEYPLNRVTFIEAQSKCAELGKRLCTMHEWLRACQGPGRWKHCYGDEFDSDCCNASETIDAHREKSGSRLCCKSVFGAVSYTHLRAHET